MTNSNLITLISTALENSHFGSVFHVPGFGGTEVFAEIKRETKIRTFMNLNEEPAFSMSYGSSTNGMRSGLLIKSQGFAKAMNAITSSLSTDTQAANLIFVFDDVEGKSSDNILNTKRLLTGSEIPWMKLTINAYAEIFEAIKLSEKLKLPVALLVDCRDLFKDFEYLSKKLPQPKAKTRDVFRSMACPPLTKFHRERLVQKLKTGSEKVKKPKINDIGNLLPKKLKTGYESYEKFFKVFQKMRPSFVAGDTGTSALFAFKPYESIDSCTYMGAGPGTAAGAIIAGKKDAICITGDFTFFSAGILGLNEAIMHNIPIKIILFWNGKAHATGGQELNPILLENFKRTHEPYLKEIFLEDKKLEKKLAKFIKLKDLSIIVIKTT